MENGISQASWILQRLFAGSFALVAALAVFAIGVVIFSL
jgi:hypothetical protein